MGFSGIFILERRHEAVLELALGLLLEPGLHCLRQRPLVNRKVLLSVVDVGRPHATMATVSHLEQRHQRLQHGKLQTGGTSDGHERDSVQLGVSLTLLTEE